MRLYSAAFLSLILFFLTLLGDNKQPFRFLPNGSLISFETIIKNKNIEESLPLKTVRLYTDFTCRPCRDYAFGAIRQLKKDYVDSGKIKLEVVAIPLFDHDEIGMKAALIAQCAGKTGDFWKTHDQLFRLQEKFPKKLDEIAEDLKNDNRFFKECLASEEIRQVVLADREAALSQGVNEVPTLSIGDYKLIGNQPYENIEYILRKFLTSNS
ncbi:thioredoxin domain-containing protein [Candidatus Peregrinibacteria bacterium]|nr:thioredoxin domain-containing protein [Candidatus Peregrinibacteria bacterium]